MDAALRKIVQYPGIVLQRVTTKFPFAKRKSFQRAKRFLFKLRHWETWDWRVKYFLIMPAWFWFCLKARSFWFFTSSNPTLTFGGFDGESKMEMYKQLPPERCPRSILITPDLSFGHLKDLISNAGIKLPFAVKPDVGRMGFMFRTVTSMAQLAQYHCAIKCPYIVQDLVTLPLEVSVFYYRFPGKLEGAITGFVRKEFLEVQGDGKSTLNELIDNYARVQFRLEEMKAKHRERLHCVIEKGETFCLSPALNLSRGGRLISLESEKNESLQKVFDDLSHYNGNFFYGRYDIRCTSVDDLKQGKNFMILEFNGSGAEPHHVYSNQYRLFEACKILVNHWSVLCDISIQNRRMGLPYWSFRKGLHFLLKANRHLARLKELDSVTPL